MNTLVEKFKEDIKEISEEIAYSIGGGSDSWSVDEVYGVVEDILKDYVDKIIKKEVTRVEVIDHYTGGGRIFVHKVTNQDRKIDYELQDDGRTLKVFISKKL